MREATKERVIYEDRLVVVFADPASRFSYGVRILTKRALDNISRTTPAERRSLAKALFHLMPLIRAKEWSYNFYFHDVFDQTDELFEIRFAPRASISLPGCHQCVGW